MNIYMTGAHGTGKTSVAEEIARTTEFSNLKSVSRWSPHVSGTPENQRFIMEKVQKRCNMTNHCVHERTPLDVFAYTSLMGIESEYTPQKMKVERFLDHLKHTGNKIFYFPVLFDLESDGVRPGKWEQSVVDKTIKTQLDNSGVNYATVPMGSVEERAQFILKEIGYATV